MSTGEKKSRMRSSGVTSNSKIIRRESVDKEVKEKIREEVFCRGICDLWTKRGCALKSRFRLELCYYCDEVDAIEKIIDGHEEIRTYVSNIGLMMQGIEVDGD